MRRGEELHDRSTVGRRRKKMKQWRQTKKREAGVAKSAVRRQVCGGEEPLCELQ